MLFFHQKLHKQEAHSRFVRTQLILFVMCRQLMWWDLWFSLRSFSKPNHLNLIWCLKHQTIRIRGSINKITNTFYLPNISIFESQKNNNKSMENYLFKIFRCWFHLFWQSVQSVWMFAFELKSEMFSWKA